VQLYDAQSVTGSRVISTHIHNSEKQRKNSVTSDFHPLLFAPIVELDSTFSIHPKTRIASPRNKMFVFESIPGPVFGLSTEQNIPALAYGSWVEHGRMRHPALNGK